MAPLPSRPVAGLLMMPHGRGETGTPTQQGVVAMLTNMTNLRNSDGTLATYVWPGGYPVVYLTADSGALCPECANMAEREGLTSDPHDSQWYIVAHEIHFEGAPYYCDHCGVDIESAYGDPETQQTDI